VSVTYLPSEASVQVTVSGAETPPQAPPTPPTPPPAKPEEVKKVEVPWWVWAAAGVGVAVLVVGLVLRLARRP
jgi:hypothetical protein